MGRGEIADHRQQICFVVDRSLVERIDAVAGVLKSKKNLAHVLLEERAAEYGRENKK